MGQAGVTIVRGMPLGTPGWVVFPGGMGVLGGMVLRRALSVGLCRAGRRLGRARLLVA